MLSLFLLTQLRPLFFGTFQNFSYFCHCNQNQIYNEDKI
uniref:Uncharacterized protein n=1 Tax=Myoviridae sp. ctPoO4 TaxID=2827685 RepID=A0A8S5SNG3_9CAUD|nr:MAG TPA: hypothetical protein [Myoviridae sp. ctPoO4]